MISKKKLIVPVIMASLLMVMATPAVSIKNGTLDGDTHPFVGLMVADDADGNPLWRCTGTLLSSTVFLTAGHCTEAPAARATIWFEADVESGIPGNGYPFGGSTSADGTTYTHPNYQPGLFLWYDAGIVVLDEPVEMDEYGTLPEAGFFESLLTNRGNQNQHFTAVGYGVQRIVARDNPHGPTHLQADIVRYQADLMLVGDADLLNQIPLPDFHSVQFTNNAAGGGTCFGDSGGPAFYGDTNMVTAVSSFGINQNCAGAGFHFALDTDFTLSWIYSYIGEK